MPLSEATLKSYYLFIYLLFISSHMHTLFGPFLPHTLLPSSSPNPLSLPGRICSAFICNFVEEKT
jgi:hypothetical protein